MLIFLFAGPVVVMAVAVYAWVSAPGHRWLEAFTAHLAAIVRRNLPLGSSLNAFARDLPGWSYRKRRIVLEVADAVENGSSLADALDAKAGAFPLTYRALVRAGELGGNIGGVLDYLREYAAARHRAARRAVASLVYPAALCIVVGSAYAFLAAVVLPRFAEMIEDLSQGAASPAPLWFVMGATEIATRYWYLVPLAAIALYLLLRAATLKPTKAPLSSWLNWHAPFFSRYERRRAVAQYALAASRLMEAGVPTQEAVVISAEASGNRCFERIATAAAGRTAEGTPLSEALRAADPKGWLPREFVWYVEVGEKSGDLPGALMAASKSAAVRSESALSQLVGLVFPAGILVVAFMVGALGYAIFDAMVVMMKWVGL